MSYNLNWKGDEVLDSTRLTLSTQTRGRAAVRAVIAGSAGYAEFLVKNCTFELINYIQNLCMRSSRQLFELKNIKSKVIYVRLKVIYVRLKVIYVRPKVIYVR